MTLRPAAQADEDSIWEIFHTVIAGGDTSVFDPAMSREEAMAYWFRTDTHTYVSSSPDTVPTIRRSNRFGVVFDCRDPID